MINNNTDDFGCLQNSLFSQLPTLFWKYPEAQDKPFFDSWMLYGVNKESLFLLFKLLHILCEKTPGQYCTESWENVYFKNDPCALLLTPSNTRPRLTTVPTWQRPHQRTLLRHLLCVFPSKPIARLCHQPEVSAVTFWVALSNGIS